MSRGVAAGLLGQSREWGEGGCLAAAFGPREGEWTEGGRERAFGREGGFSPFYFYFLFYFLKPFLKIVLSSFSSQTKHTSKKQLFSSMNAQSSLLNL